MHKSGQLLYYIITIDLQFYQQNTMLRKNTIINTTHTASAHTQTEEFLLYSTVNHKIEQVYQEYSALKNSHRDTLNQLEFALFKNKYLQDSLFETMYLFNERVMGQNNQNIQEVKALNERISREMGQLQAWEKMDGNRNINLSEGLSQQVMNANSFQTSIISSKNQTQEQILHSKRLSQPSNDNKRQTPCDYKRQMAQQNKRQTGCDNKGVSAHMTQSYNEFLPIEPSASETDSYSKLFQQTRKPILQQKDASNRKERYSKLHSHKAHHDRQSHNNDRHSHNNDRHSHNNNDRNRINNNDRNRINNNDRNRKNKENGVYEKLFKLQAELKLKDFMSKFDSQDDEQSIYKGVKLMR